MLAFVVLEIGRNCITRPFVSREDLRSGLAEENFKSINARKVKWGDALPYKTQRTAPNCSPSII